MSALALAIVASVGTQPSPPTFAVGVESVYVDIFVTDGNRPVVGLTEADFEVRDNGVRQRAELISVEKLPLSVLLVLDTSASVAGDKLAQLQTGAWALVAGLRPDDEATLLTFDEEVRLRVPQTTDRTSLEEGIRGIRPGGATGFFDALYAGAVLASGRGRSLLVVFTDGEDNVSWLDATQVRRVLLESNVLVQAVGIVPGQASSDYPDGLIVRSPDETSQVTTLRQLAEVTGGRFWPASAPNRLADAFRAILEAMKTRYVLRFEPAHARREGLHEIDVKLKRRRGTVHCRRAYFVAPPSDRHY